MERANRIGDERIHSNPLPHPYCGDLALARLLDVGDHGLHVPENHSRMGDLRPRNKDCLSRIADVEAVVEPKLALGAAQQMRDLRVCTWLRVREEDVQHVVELVPEAKAWFKIRVEAQVLGPLGRRQRRHRLHEGDGEAVGYRPWWWLWLWCGHALVPVEGVDGNVPHPT